MEGINYGQMKGMLHVSTGAEIVVNNLSQYGWSVGKDTNSGPPEYGATHWSITQLNRM